MMDGLTQYLALRDGVTGPLRSMTDAAEKLYESQEEAARAMGNLERQMTGVGNAVSKAGGSFTAASAGMKTMIGQFALGNIAANAFFAAAGFVTELPGKIVGASDAYAGMIARLNLVTGSAQEAAQMNEMIYQSALRARGSYDGMAGSVSKIAMTAKDAFPDPRTVVPFVEGIQKLFAIGGTGIQQQADAMLQLTQALGSGKLQGDEFRSIAEAAPLIEQMVARHMGIAQGELKQLSSQGVITADILRDAILENMDEINADFAKMPLTWGQALQNMGTVASHAMAPAYEAISGLAGSDAVSGFMAAFSAVMPVVGNALAGVIRTVSAGMGAIGSVLSYLADWGAAAFLAVGRAFEAVYPLIIGGLAGWAAYLVIVNGHLAVEAALEAAAAAASAAHTAATTIATAAKAAWTTATNMQTAAAAALNAVLNANPIMLVARLALFAVAAFAAWQAGTIGLRNTVAEAFRMIADIAGSVINFVIDKINLLIGGINAVAGGLNKILGSDIKTIGTIEWRADNWGGKAYDAVQSFDPEKLVGELTTVPGGAVSAPGGYGGAMDMPESPAERETAENTKGILDAMDIMDEDIKFFRDAAEQEVVNRYTTASVQIHLENTNNITNDVDADGMITHLIDQLEEAELAGAEAVHI